MVEFEFHYLIKQDLKNNFERFITEKFDGFNILSVEFSKKLRQPFCPIDIMHKPVKKSDDIINYYFNEKLNIAFHASFNEGSKIKHCSFCWCYFCSNYARDDKFDCHFENYTGHLD